MTTSEFIAELTRRGFIQRSDRPDWWQLIVDRDGPNRRCITVDMTIREITVSGTTRGHAIGSEVREELLPSLWKVDRLAMAGKTTNKQETNK